MSFGKLAGTVVTELCFQQVAVGKRVVDTTYQGFVGLFVEVATTCLHSTNLTFGHSRQQIRHRECQVANGVEVITVALLDFPTNDTAYVVNIVESAVVVHGKLTQHLRLVIKLATHIAGRTFVVDLLVVSTGLLVVSILIVLFAESLVVVGTVVVAEHSLGSQAFQYRCIFTEVSDTVAEDWKYFCLYFL